MEPVRGVVFDLWNTLAHHPGGENPLERVAEVLGVRGRPDWVRTLSRASMTRSFPDLAAALPDIESAFRLEAVEARRTRVLRAWATADASAALFPDVLPVLDGLARRGQRLGLLSNTQSFGLSILDRSGLRRRLHAVSLSCDTGWLKPDRRAFEDVARRLALPPEALVMVGDNEADDVAGARAAGLRAVLIRREVRGLSHREAGGGEALRELTSLLTFLA